MNKLNGWDQARAQMGGEFEQLSPGGHVVKVLGVNMAQSRAGKEMLVLRFDIYEGSDFDGMMQRIWRGRGANAEWPNQGTMYQLTVDKDGNANPRFKGLITAVEQSNANYRWNWDENSLKSKIVGLIFREEEYINQSGEVRTTVKPFACCAAREAAEKPAPNKKTLPPDQLNAAQTSQNNAEMFTEEDNTDDLPF